MNIIRKMSFWSCLWVRSQLYQENLLLLGDGHLLHLMLVVAVAVALNGHP